MSDVCVYFHINPIKQEIFYVGIGSIDRPFYKKHRSNWWNDTVKKYGVDIIVIHENLTWEYASELEIKYIKQIGRRDKGLGTLVNMTDGGDGKRGWTPNNETLLKMSIIKKGKPTWNKGKTGVQTCSDDTKKLISIKNKRFYQVNNIRKTNEYKKKMSEASGTKKSIIKYNKNFEKIKEYNSINDAAKENKIHRTTISACLRGILKHAGNFIWKYK